MLYLAESVTPMTQFNPVIFIIIIIAGVAIWLLMTFFFVHTGPAPTLGKPDQSPSAPMDLEVKVVEVDDDLQKIKRQALEDKKRRDRRRDFIRRLLKTLKKAGVLLLECSWMIGLSIAIILTVYFVTQNMLID